LLNASKRHGVDCEQIKNAVLLLQIITTNANALKRKQKANVHCDLTRFDNAGFLAGGDYDLMKRC